MQSRSAARSELAALFLLALSVGCDVRVPLSIVIKDPVDLRLAAPRHTANVHAESGQNRCEVYAGVRENGVLPDGGVTPLRVADVCVALRCGAEESIFGHLFSCECSGDQLLDQCLNPQP